MFGELEGIYIATMTGIPGDKNPLAPLPLLLIFLFAHLLRMLAWLLPPNISHFLVQGHWPPFSSSTLGQMYPLTHLRISLNLWHV